MRSVGIIPSRYASTRFPGKPLVVIKGKTMIQRVYEQAIKSAKLSDIYVATDDKRIFNNVIDFGGKVIMTDVHHENGTTRCNEVIDILQKGRKYFDLVINIQGDEPYINPNQIDNLISLFENEEVEIGTLAKKITTNADLHNENVVKVIFTNTGKAMYFSRLALPFQRGVEQKQWLENFSYYKHVGIYGYRTNILRKISKMEIGSFENAEKLEQLRWLEHNIYISVKITDYESVAIDTKEDLLKLETKN